MVCDECEADVPLTMPVHYDTTFMRWSQRECLSCRLGYHAADLFAAQTLRVEGRHNLPGAWPVPCSLMAFERRVP